MAVCPHIILSATLFHVLCIPLRVLRVALYVRRVHSSLNMFLKVFWGDRGKRSRYFSGVLQ